MLSRPALLCAPLLCLSMGAMAHAADVIVHWGGNHVTAHQPFSNFDTDNNIIGGFSLGDPLLISPTSGYVGSPFYGVVRWDADGLDGSYGRIEQSGNTDRIEIKRYKTDLRALIVWRQDDFLNGYHTGNVAFDATSTVSMRVATYVNFDPGRVVIRLQGGDKDGYYISQEAPFNASGDISANLTSLTWLAYDPATSLTTFGSAVNLLSGGKIDHVTEVGYYVRSQNAGAANAFRVSIFEVTAVPEPAALSLLGIGAVLLGRRRR